MTALECIAAARESIAASKVLQIKIRRERPDARTVGGEIGDAIEKKLAFDALSRKHREAWEKWNAKKWNAQAPAQRGIGDLVEAFTAGTRTEAILNMEREEK